MVNKIDLLISNEFKINIKYFYFSFFICIYLFLPYIFIYTSLISIILTLSSFFTIFLISKISKTIFLIIALFTLILNSFAFHIYLHWGNSVITSRLQAALLSPNYETLEYLKTYLSFYDIAIIFYLFLGISLFFFFIKLTHTYKIFKLLSIFLLLLLLLELNSLNLITNITPFTYVNALIEANSWKNITDKRQTYLDTIVNKNTNLSKNNLNYDKVIIILGESVNKSHLGSYGYNLKTTPFLSTLLKDKNSYKFNNVIAPTNQTRYSIPIYLTDATVENFDNFMTSTSIISDFKIHGYKSY